MAPFPDLETALTDGTVSLRRFRLDDVGDVTRACQDPEIVRWTASVPTPYSAADARAWIELHDELWTSQATAPLAIIDAKDGSFVGSVDVMLPPNAEGRAVLGYWVAPWARDKGAATRALLLATRWAIDVIGPPELLLQTLEGNVASERVAEKAGYEFAGYRKENYTQPAIRSPDRREQSLRVKRWVFKKNP